MGLPIAGNSHVWLQNELCSRTPTHPGDQTCGCGCKTSPDSFSETFLWPNRQIWLCSGFAFLRDILVAKQGSNRMRPLGLCVLACLCSSVCCASSMLVARPGPGMWLTGGRVNLKPLNEQTTAHGHGHTECVRNT